MPFSVISLSFVLLITFFFIVFVEILRALEEAKVVELISSILLRSFFQLWGLFVLFLFKVPPLPAGEGPGERLSSPPCRGGVGGEASLWRGRGRL
jgi:hypothetical protein